MHNTQTKSQFPREIFGQLDHNLDIYAPHSPGTFPVREFHFDSDLNFVAECISFTSTFTHWSKYQVILFFPGMACTTPATAYSNILTHLVSFLF